VRLKPYVYTVSVDPVRFNGNTYVSGWTCKTATGYRNYIYAWSAQSIGRWLLDAVAGALDEAAAREWCKTNCLPLTAEQMTDARALVAGRLASAKVSASGTATTRPVYSVSGTTRTIVPNARVAIGEACDIGMRLGTTSYFSVAGKPNVAVAGSYPALGDVYAICTFVAPSGVND
jgi:hypothetical protein